MVEVGLGGVPLDVYLVPRGKGYVVDVFDEAAGVGDHDFAGGFES